MVLDCKLCGEISLTRYICEDCNFIKDCINIYSKETVIDVIRRTLIRNDKQRTYKIDTIIKERLNNELDDSTYINKDEEQERKELKEKSHREIKKKVLEKFNKI